MIQFKINPTQNPQNPSHRPKHCLRKIEDLIFIILLQPLINNQHDDILNRNLCQSLKTRFCSVFQQQGLDFGVDFGSTIGHSTYLFAIQFLKIGKQLFQKYSFRGLCVICQEDIPFLSQIFAPLIKSLLLQVIAAGNSFKFIILSFQEINLQSLPTNGSQFYDGLLSGLQLPRTNQI